MYYDIESNSVYILYEENKSNKSTHHRFEGKPIFLQLDPLKPSHVYSVYFNEAPPYWMKDYASKNRFDFQTAYLEGEGEGFSVTAYEQYISDSITIEGKIQDWFKVANKGYEEIKTELLANSQIVENNLLHYPELFESYGLKVRPSEFDPNHYCINFRNIDPYRNIVISRMEEDSEYSDEIIGLNKKWHKLKDELITIREYPIEPSDEIEAIEDIPSSNTSPSIDIEVPSIEIEMPLVEASTVEIEVPSIEIEMPLIEASTVEIEVPSIEIEMPLVEASTVEIEVPSIEIEMPLVEASTVEIEVPSFEFKQSFIAEETTEHLIVKQSNKKSDLISGQVLLF